MNRLGADVFHGVSAGIFAELPGGKFANREISALIVWKFDDNALAQKGLATSYAESNGEGWVDEFGNVYLPDPNFHNPEPGLNGVYPEALLPVGRVARGVAAARFTLFKLRLFGQSTTAANGSRIYYQMTSSGRYNFSAYNNSGSLITSGQGWNAGRLTSMAKRYGWEGF